MAAALLAACGGDEPGPQPDGPPPSTEAGRPSAAPAEPPADDSVERMRLLAAAAEAQAALLAEESASEAGPLLAEGTLGADASWPQCPKGLGIPERPTLGAPMPLPEARYVVLGLTNGPGYTPNPCLAEQVAWARRRDVPVAAYAVASLPDADQLAQHRDDGPYDGDAPLGALRNAGYAQARYNLETMADADLASPIIWIDVEPVPDFDWGPDLAANAAVVEGLARAYRDAGLEIGVYSTPYLWADVVGDLQLGVPEWRAAGHTSRTEAASRCGTEWTIQGGAAVFGQWVEAGRDQNVTCVDLHAGNWFDLG
ncbi:hypothetical protein [Nocardioides ferulae]|uniref:hypothetical protein n=1 Tax=Nocardioides ferulae TaxID=2340821 RepID=UPI000F895EBE|nr:hypothetical protein [Nocardioides ferulae]